MRPPNLRSAERTGSLLADRPSLAARVRGSRCHPPSPAAAPRTCRADRNRETREGRSSGRSTSRPRISAKCAAVSPGNPTMTSRPDRGVRQTRRESARRAPRNTEPCTGRRIADSIASDPCWSGRWKCGAIRGDRAATIDDVGSAVHRLERADAEEHVVRPFAQRASRGRRGPCRPARSRPYDPRCTPVISDLP